MKKIKADFKNIIGKIKPLHACGGGPRQGGAYLSSDVTDLFKDIGIPYCRLHDIEGSYGMMQFVDVHNIFPDFEADENDHRSYNFGPTDEYIKAIKACGAKVFYRLGSSIEHFERKLFIFPPRDYKKFARICEHIVRHYNYGWCQGYYFEIEHWEIWNEPESAGMWQGSYREFYEFYSVVANHLKSCFPELKVGGYSAVGFYTETRKEVANPWFKTILPFMNGFFDYITAEGTKAPLDFFSWHCYASYPEETVKAGAFVRKYLDDRGFKNTESYLTEYNTEASLNICPAVIPSYGAELAAALISAQNGLIDIMFYYDLRFTRMNGVIARSADWKSGEPLHGYYAMKTFGNIYRLGLQASASSDCGEIYVLAGSDGKNGALMMAVRDYEGEAEIELSGTEKRTFTVKEAVYSGQGFESKKITATDNKLKIFVKRHSVYYVE